MAVAPAADRAGALYVGVCEHIAIPAPHDRTMGTTWYHPVTTLGFLAGVTTSVRLLSHVIALPYHHPLEVAKAFTTLDALSGGRAIVGVGAGHVEAEFALLGADFAGRGRWVERSLPAIRAALDHEYPALPGGDWGLDGSAAVSPRPVQASVPIWVGGSSPVACAGRPSTATAGCPRGAPGRPAWRGGPGARPAGGGRATRALRRRRLARAATSARPPGTWAAPTWGPPSGSPSSSGRVEAGANQLQVRFRLRDQAELVDQIERFGAEVAPLLPGLTRAPCRGAALRSGVTRRRCRTGPPRAR